MTSRIRLDLPVDFPEWATGAGRTLEPDATGPEGSKDQGWVEDYEPPARWFNWLHNLTFNWLRRLGAGIVSNWFISQSVGADLRQVLYSELNDFWLSIQATDAHLSNDGVSWGAANAMGGNAATSGGDSAFNTTHILIPAVTGRIKYSTNGTVWADENTLLVGEVRACDSKYPASDYIIAGDVGANIRFSTTGIGGVWTLPTTAPTATTAIQSIIHAAGSIWYGFSVDGHCFKTLNDGVDWANLTNQPSAIFAAGDLSKGDYNPNKGTLVAVGRTAGVAGLIAYTTDDGATAWNTATIEGSPLSAIDPPNITAVRYLGGNIWIAAGLSSTTVAGMYPINILISFDDGVTWKRALLHEDTAAGNNISLYTIANSSKHALVGGGLVGPGTPVYYHSNSIIGE